MLPSGSLAVKVSLSCRANGKYQVDKRRAHYIDFDEQRVLLAVGHFESEYLVPNWIQIFVDDIGSDLFRTLLLSRVKDSQVAVRIRPSYSSNCE